MCAQQRGKMRGGRGMLSGTQRELSAEFAGVGGNVEVFKGGCEKRVREDGGRGPVCRKGSGLRRNGLTEPGTRSECADGSKAH